MAKALGWGILGTGNIARQFAEHVIATSARSKVVAAASRTEEKAREFATKHGLPNAYGSYDGLLTDPAVEAVYVSLPNHMHHEWTLKCLAAGKHVLCEKPIGASAAEAVEMFDAAQKHGRVLAEAFMYRSHPLTHAVVDAVRSGTIGQLRMIRTSFCFRTNTIDTNIRFKPEMAGGAVMDVGCYCVNFTRLFAGEQPSTVTAQAHRHERGVDDITVGTLAFPSGIVASFTCGMTVHADNTAYLCGSDGYIEVPIPYKPPTQNAEYRVKRSIPPRMDGVVDIAREFKSEMKSHFVNAPVSLYALEADDFAATVLDGAPQRVTAQDSIDNMRVLDEIRRQIAGGTQRTI